MTWTHHFYDDSYIFCVNFFFFFFKLCTVTHQKLNEGYEFTIHNIYKK